MNISVNLPVPSGSLITQYFGEHPEWYAKWGYKGHNGVDFACSIGTPVRASADGIVDKTAIEAGGYGKYIRVAHENGQWMTWYCHLSDNNIQPGRVVKAGEVIGFSGNTGNSTGPHLHWGLSIPSKQNPGYKSYFDPLLYVGKGQPEQPPVVVPPTVEPEKPPVIELSPIMILENILDVPVNVRSGPGVNFDKVGEIAPGGSVVGEFFAGPEIWVQHGGGWSAAIYGGELYLEAK